MTDEQLMRQLYLALKMMPCRCEYGPEWRSVLQSVVCPPPVKQCSRCRAVDEYEARYADAG